MLCKTHQEGWPDTQEAPGWACQLLRAEKQVVPMRFKEKCELFNWSGRRSFVLEVGGGSAKEDCKGDFTDRQPPDRGENIKPSWAWQPAALQSQRVTASCLSRSTSQACSHWHRQELLQFQCFLHPAAAVDSLIESDGVKHNKKDDLMGLLLKPFCNFHYQKKSLLEWYPLLSKCFLKAKIQGMQSTPAVSA